ncbi:unnamed protein product [Moneuplotes crassus]|uniref:Uncharacterized protein n=1 Tax=Euplotes crassus TaxID=5936 RepID=A0AAD1UDB0_EUPCR|nr:unnamed protein product [Moneuplotes crassus]
MNEVNFWMTLKLSKCLFSISSDTFSCREENVRFVNLKMEASADHPNNKELFHLTDVGNNYKTLGSQQIGCNFCTKIAKL